MKQINLSNFEYFKLLWVLKLNYVVSENFTTGGNEETLRGSHFDDSVALGGIQRIWSIKLKRSR